MKQQALPRLLVALLVVLLAFAGSVQSAAAAPNKLPIAPYWGACGIFTDENKVVRTYSKEFILRCGGPRLSNHPRWGYRHIIKNHRDGFKRLVSPLLMQRNWRDLTDFVIEWTIIDPDKSPKALGGGQVCRERVFWLADANGRTVLKQKFRLYTAGNRINSAHSTTSGC